MRRETSLGLLKSLEVDIAAYRRSASRMGQVGIEDALEMILVG